MQNRLSRTPSVSAAIILALLDGKRCDSQMVYLITDCVSCQRYPTIAAGTLV